MTVLNGTVMVLGPGLHALPGCGHHAIAGQADHTDENDDLRIVSGEKSAASCAICEHLTQSKMFAERVHVVAFISSVRSTSPLPSILHNTKPQRAYGSRAPPSAHIV